MSKKLNEWLDEFVENGADANDVTSWPENAGGETGYIFPSTSYFKLNVVELVKYIQQVDDDESIQFLFGYEGKGGSGVEANYERIQIGVNSDSNQYYVQGTQRNTGIVDITFGDSETQSLTEAMLEYKNMIEETVFENISSVILCVMSDHDDAFYPIDLNKVLTFVSPQEL